MEDTYPCDGCPRHFGPESLFICTEPHEQLLDPAKYYLLCPGCFEAHRIAYQASDGSHYPPQEYLH